MNLLLAFSPFIAFAIVDRTVAATPGLIAGALVAAALVLRDALSRLRRIKILEVGTVILFGGLTPSRLISAPCSHMSCSSF
jgi:intracellular septation protein A